MEKTIETIEEIDTLDIQSGEPMKIKYKSEYFEYNLLIYYKERFDNIVVLSNGAVNLEKKNPPVFMRSKWAREIEGSLIYLDDATIHGTGLNLGWGQGKKEEFVLEIYNKIIYKIVSNLNISNEKVCYFGSSAGGFMSMLLSTMHKGSFVIANNPQTDIKSYHEGHSKPLLNLSYGSVEDAYKMYPERVNVVTAIQKCGFVPKIYYIQNQFSAHDLKFHVNPLVKSMKENNLNLSNIVFINYFDKERGHTPLDKEPALNSLNLLLKNDLF